MADGKALRQICKDPALPARDTVAEWVRQDYLGFSARYARARELQADALVDDILGIVDEHDVDPNDKRVRMEARKWVAGKIMPKVYGDKIEIDATVKMKDMPDDRVDARLAQLLGAAGIAGIDGGEGTPETQTED
jgi:hypothetical protein